MLAQAVFKSGFRSTWVKVWATLCKDFFGVSPDPVWHVVLWRGWDSQIPLDNRSLGAAMLVTLDAFSWFLYSKRIQLHLLLYNLHLPEERCGDPRASVLLSEMIRSKIAWGAKAIIIVPTWRFDMSQKARELFLSPPNIFSNRTQSGLFSKWSPWWSILSAKSHISG